MNMPQLGMVISVVEQPVRRTENLRQFRILRVLPILATALCLVHVGAQSRESSYRSTVLAIQQQIESGNLDAARVQISAALVRFPSNGGLENLLGVVEVQQGHMDAARKAFRAAVRDDPTLAGAYLNLGRVDMESAATDAAIRAEAKRMCERVLELDPASDEAYYLLATLLTWERSYQSALNELGRMSLEARGQVGAMALDCADEAGTGNVKATTEAALALTANPALSEPDAWTCIPQLRAAERAELIDELLTSASAHGALTPRGQRMLGLAQEAEGKLAAARMTLEGAFSAGAAPVATLVDLTRVAMALGDNQGALGYLAHARDLDPKDARLPYEFGVICLRMGMFAEARKALGTALEVEPKNADYNLGMGLVVSYSEDPSQAVVYLEKYHALRPDAPEGLLALGGALFRAKEFDQSANWLKQAVSHPETAAEAHYYLARIARQQGQLDEAKRELNECLRRMPDQANALAELGQIAVAERDYPRAAETLQRAVALDADNYAANFGLLQLFARTNDVRREAQAKRFDEIKDKKEERDLQMMRSIEIRRDDDRLDRRETSSTNH